MIQLSPVTDELDAASVPALERQLAAIDPDETVELDLSAVTFCDSSGVHILAADAMNRRRHGAQLRPSNVAPSISRLFEVTGFAALISHVRPEPSTPDWRYALPAIRQHLHHRYPDLGAETVDVLLTSAIDETASARIQTYRAILIERHVERGLRQLSALTSAGSSPG